MQGNVQASDVGRWRANLQGEIEGTALVFYRTKSDLQWTEDVADFLRRSGSDLYYRAPHRGSDSLG